VDYAHAEFHCPALVAHEHFSARIGLKGLFKFQLQALFADFCAAPSPRCVPFGELDGKINGEARASIFKSLHSRPVVRERA
jgi:hypothetical protein